MHRLALLVSIAAVLAGAGCSLGDDAPQSAAPPAVPALRPPAAARGTVLDRHRPRILRALAADAACRTPACTTLPGFRRRAEALADSVGPLDEELAAVPTMEAKNARVATSVVRHAARQLQTCSQLSAAKHEGGATLAECRGPVADFRQAVEYLRASVAAGSR